jgi:mannose-1-phosphate guanylyltransferase
VDVEPDHRYAVILAGGRGTRLWPISTTQQPKQFQSLGDSRSLIAMTFDRLAECVPEDHIYVSTTAGYAADVREALPQLAAHNLIVEPRPEGKAAAFLLIALRIAERDPEAVLLSAAADSFVAPIEAFQAASATAFEFVDAHPDWAAILGSRPTRPDTSLGYLRATGSARGAAGVRVLRDFGEKPTREVAQTYVTDGNYFWNSSHYCFAVATLETAYRQAAPRLHAAVSEFANTGAAEAYRGWDSPEHELLPFIDYGWSVGVVECDFSWNDVGTWPSLYRALLDSQERPFIPSRSGRHADLDSVSGLVVNESSLSVVTAGLQDIVVVVSDSVVLVAPIDALEDDPQIVVRLQSRIDELGATREAHLEPAPRAVSLVPGQAGEPHVDLISSERVQELLSLGREGAA